MIELAVTRGGRSQSNLVSFQMRSSLRNKGRKGRTLSDRAGGGKRREEPEQSHQLMDGCFENNELES